MTEAPDSTELVSEISRRIRAARAYAEITQEQMAENLGVSIVTYKRVESNKREVTSSELARIAEVTGMPLDFFTGDIHEMGATKENKEQLEKVRSQISDLVARLEDIEWRMRRTVMGKPE